MQRTVLLLVAVVLITGVGLASTGAAQSGAGVPAGGFEQMDVAPDDVLIEATVEPDGDAVWETQYRVRLASDDEKQAFEELRADVESDPDAYTGRFAERMRATAGVAENATGREMNVTNVTVTAERRELPQSYGVLTYRFEWSNFAATDGDRLVVGDAVDALFLDEATSLIVSWEDGYRLGDVSPSPTETRDSAVVWEGPVDFTEGEPRVTIEPDGRSAGPLLLIAIGLLVAIVAVVGYRRRPWERSASDRRSDAPGATAGGSTDDTTDATSDASVAGAADTDEGGESDDDLLSNEEQVLRLVEASGGRMKQKRVAEELDWTAAKTSQVVTGLRDEGDLDGFRLGRENVISLPDYDAASENSGEDGGDDDNE